MAGTKQPATEIDISLRQIAEYEASIVRAYDERQLPTEENARQRLVVVQLAANIAERLRADYRARSGR